MRTIPGGIDARELRSFAYQATERRMAAIDHQEGRRAGSSEGEAARLAPRTEQKGTSLSSVFHALDEDDSGALSVNELLSVD